MPLNKIRPGHLCFLVSLLLLSVHFWINFSSSPFKTPTYDERAHLTYGYGVLKGNTDRIDDSKMPITALNALPFLKINHFNPSKPIYWKLFHEGRRYTMVFAFLLGLFIFIWAKRMHSSQAGLFATALYVLSPSILGHARWITTDIYAAFAITLSLYTFWEAVRSKKTGWMVIAGLCLGISQLAKFTAIYCYPLFIAIALIHFLSNPNRFSWTFVVKILFIFGVTSLALINIGYLFNGTGMPLASYEFKSQLFQSLQSFSAHLSGIPLPLPQPFIEGLDWVKFNEVTGAYRGPAYLFGEVSKEPFHNFYFWVFAYKTPISVIVLFAIASIHYFKSFRWQSFADKDVFLLLPILFFMVYFNYFLSAQMGVRMILPLYPLLHVFCGITAAHLWQSATHKKLRILILGLFVYLGISVMSYHPHYLSYFNEFIGNRKNAYKVLADSNLDWAQNEWYLKKFMQKNPEITKNSRTPVSGRIIVSTNFLTGVIYPADYAWYGWVRENLTPVGHVTYNYLMYDIEPEHLNKINDYLRSKE